MRCAAPRPDLARSPSSYGAASRAGNPLRPLRETGAPARGRVARCRADQFRNPRLRSCSTRPSRSSLCGNVTRRTRAGRAPRSTLARVALGPPPALLAEMEALHAWVEILAGTHAGALETNDPRHRDEVDRTRPGGRAAIPVPRRTAATDGAQTTNSLPRARPGYRRSAQCRSVGSARDNAHPSRTGRDAHGPLAAGRRSTPSRRSHSSPPGLRCRSFANPGPRVPGCAEGQRRVVSSACTSRSLRDAAIADTGRRHHDRDGRTRDTRAHPWKSSSVRSICTSRPSRPRSAS